MTFRPIKMIVHYVPQVDVTTPGTVVMGTLWNGTTQGPEFQQTLVTSNGGMLTQVYVPASTEIRLGSALPQNMFNISGPLTYDTTPFIFVAIARGTTSIPGYFMVQYEYECKNPVGAAFSFNINYGITVTDMIANYHYVNTGIVQMEQANGFGPGTVLQVRWDTANGAAYYYNNQQVEVDPTTVVTVLQNQQAISSVPIPGGGGSEGMLQIHSVMIPTGGPGSTTTYTTQTWTGGSGRLLIDYRLRAGDPVPTLNNYNWNIVRCTLTNNSATINDIQFLGYTYWSSRAQTTVPADAVAYFAIQGGNATDSAPGTVYRLRSLAGEYLMRFDTYSASVSDTFNYQIFYLTFNDLFVKLYVDILSSRSKAIQGIHYVNEVILPTDDPTEDGLPEPSN